MFSRPLVTNSKLCPGQKLRLLGLLCLLSYCPAIGCRAIRTPPASPLPVAYKLKREQLVVHSDFSLDDHQQLINELVAQRERVAAKLDLPTTDVPIHIYLFDNEAKYYDFLDLRFPGFPSRRAIFVETDVELVIYAHWGDHVAEDLRHEVTHGYLHAAIPHLPLWLDEGLAEYFEVAPNRKGLNTTHLRHLTAQENYQPNLARLEQLTNAATMTQQEYAESWAWVHFLLESDITKTHVLTDYIANLRQGVTTSLNAELKNRLTQPELALIGHMRGLQ